MNMLPVWVVYDSQQSSFSLYLFPKYLTGAIHIKDAARKRGCLVVINIVMHHRLCLLAGTNRSWS